MPVKDGSALRARLVDGGCHSCLCKRWGRVLKATQDQMISTQVWRIPQERKSVNMPSERPWQYVQRITVPFPREWGNTFPCRQIVR